MHLDNLIQQFQQKDTVAFESLYNMYADNICGAINVILKDSERSEEICQDVFVKIWEKSDQYDPSKGRFFTWILNIARNAAIDEVRSKTHKNQKKNLPVDSLVSIFESGEDCDGAGALRGKSRCTSGRHHRCTSSPCPESAIRRGIRKHATSWRKGDEIATRMVGYGGAASHRCVHRGGLRRGEPQCR